MSLLSADFWHSARGPVVSLAPATRLLLAAFVLVACGVARPTRVVELVHLLVSVGLWLLLTRPPQRIPRGALLLGLVLLGPLFLWSPLIEAPTFASKLAVPWVLFTRGLAVLLVTSAAATTLSPTELYQGLRSLRVPQTVAMLVLQLLQQTGSLIQETRGIQVALSMRGASDSWRDSCRLAFSLPLVWLPRVILRAERLAIAMELRGYALQHLETPGTGLARRDRAALALGMLWVLALCAFRHYGGR